MTQTIEKPTSRDGFYLTNAETISAIESSIDGESLILDFDETLFLRNSTEEYLNSIQPRLLGAIVLFALSLLKPWNWLPKAFRGDISRDWLRVIVTTLIFPWTPFLWRNKGRQLAEAYGNQALLKSLHSHQKTNLVIASNGFDFIIQPIAAQLNLPVKHLIACRFWLGVKDRQLGKKTLLADVLGEDVLTQAVAITDSEDDLPLLAAVANPCLTRWPDAKYVRAMGDFYIPFFYTERVKQPGERYIAKVVVAEDLLFVVLATSWISPNPIIHSMGMAFLMAAFWCIYEIGYMENDLIAERLEKTPKLSLVYQKYKSRINLWQPWIWAVLFSCPGVALLQASQISTEWNIEQLFCYLRNPDLIQGSFDLGKWVGFLVVLRLTFLAYNYVNKPTRVWLYPLLQIYKCFGFLVLATTNLVGSMLFVAQSFARWIIYLVYRYSKGSWNKVGQILRCLIFGVLIMAVALGTQDFSILLNWQTGLLFSYAALKANRELRMVTKEFGLINDPSRS